MSDDEEDIPVLIEHGTPPEPSLETKVPLTIICGFLGAGKSTLLKRILTEKHGYKIAVIMNEFGDTADIEGRTINVSSDEDPTAESSEEILELANGCLCCSIKDSGAAAIEKLMERKGAFDHILLETTGLADPGPIASMFWQNEEYAAGLGKDITLDGVICVVDGVFGQKQMEEDHSVEGVGESLRQIASADVLLLNKADLTTPKQLASTEGLVRRINPAAPLHRTVNGDIDLKYIMGIGAYSKRPKFEIEEHDHDAPGHTHDEPTHYELRGISSLQVTCPVLSDLQLGKLDEWIRSVLWENQLPGDSTSDVMVLRCKGMFGTRSGNRYILQGVRNMYEMVKEGGDEVLGLPEVGKLVLIGKGLDEAVRRSLESALTAT